MTDSLNAYRQKRNFDKTLEPIGEHHSTQEGLRFVVQHHLARKAHYDFRLEWDGVLLSWAVPKGPSFNIRDKRLAVQVENHPLEYRNFEGTIPQGEYGGGTVMLWDEGIWNPWGNVEDGLRKGSLKFELLGGRLRGKWAMVRLKAEPDNMKTNWLLFKEKDEYAKADAGISGFVTSIRTGRTMAEIEAGQEDKIPRNPFSSAEVQLAKLSSHAPEGENWLYELKYDGYRILAFMEDNSVRLQTRNGNDFANRYHEIASTLVEWAKGRAMVLDGEITVIDSSGRTDFQALQHYVKKPNNPQLTYILFDLLALDGADFRGRPLTERKEALEGLLMDAPKSLFYSRAVKGSGKECFAAACESGMEGIVAKKSDSVYSSSRNGEWVKIKCEKRQEFVIGGYSLTEKKTSGISALLLGIYEGEELLYVGRAGTGLSELAANELTNQFGSLHRMDSPFKAAPKPRPNEKLFWLEPRLVAEIKYAEWTDDNLLRQASFKGLRTDKNPAMIKREDEEAQALFPSDSEESKKVVNTTEYSLTIEGITITNPDRVVFENPKITKADIVRYYAAVSERMLPYLGHRILSIVRCPRGIAQSCFFKKHPGPGSREIVTIPVTNSEGKTDEYFYIQNQSGLVSEVQMGTLEFHIWGSRVETLEKPDMMVFDLDPDEGMDLTRVQQGVLELKGILAELSLTSYLKTSGGKGYHVVVPLKPAAAWEVFHDFARRVAVVMEQKWPDRYTSNVRKVKRTGRIFIDWMRNGRGATSIAPYSIRARKGGCVSLPIAWEELDRIAPDGISMADALERISMKDPWKDFYLTAQMLK